MLTTIPHPFFGFFHLGQVTFRTSVTRRKSLNVYNSCPKMISLEKFKILTSLQKLPKNVGDFGQINCCHRLWKVAQSPKNRPIWSHCLGLAKTKRLGGRVQKTFRLLSGNNKQKQAESKFSFSTSTLLSLCKKVKTFFFAGFLIHFLPSRSLLLSNRLGIGFIVIDWTLTLHWEGIIFLLYQFVFS